MDSRGSGPELMASAGSARAHRRHMPFPEGIHEGVNIRRTGQWWSYRKPAVSPEGGKLVKGREESTLVDLKFASSWSQGRTVTREGRVGFLGPSGETRGDSVALLAESRAGSGESGALRVLFIPSNLSALEKHLQKLKSTSSNPSSGGYITTLT